MSSSSFHKDKNLHGGLRYLVMVRLLDPKLDLLILDNESVKEHMIRRILKTWNGTLCARPLLTPVSQVGKAYCHSTIEACHESFQANM